jgi:cytochrome c oxidase cbb3-type subunit 4
MMSVFNGVMTGVLLLIFVGIWIWAWSSRNKESFDKLSKLPLEEDPSENPDSLGEKNNE